MRAEPVVAKIAISMMPEVAMMKTAQTVIQSIETITETAVRHSTERKVNVMSWEYPGCP